MWEKLPDTPESHESHRLAVPSHESHRLAVPGGWIVRTIFYSYKSGAAIAQTFVEDPHHEWKLKN